MKSSSAKFISLLLSACLLTGIWPLTGAIAEQVNSSAANTTDQTQKVYKSVGPDGQVIYSDQPSAGSEEITVPASGGYKPVPPPSGFTPYQPPQTRKKTPTNKVSITQPADQETIHSAEGILSVSVSLGRMQPQQTLVYQIDGKTLYTGTATSHTFKNVYRGTHVLTVQLTNGDGSPVSSASATFYMKRPFKKK